jgi:hypothetical protein
VPDGGDGGGGGGDTVTMMTMVDGVSYSCEQWNINDDSTNIQFNQTREPHSGTGVVSASRE